MLRVTVELIPYGQEEMSKTISEICIANVDTDANNVASYAVAGYHDKFGKIQEFSAEVTDFPRNDGVLELLRHVFAAERSDISDAVSETLISKTRLAQLANEGE